MRSFLLGVLVGAVAGAAGAFAYLESQKPAGQEPLLALASEHVAAASIAAPAAKKSRGKRKGKKRKGRPGGQEPDNGVVEISAADRKMVWRGPSVSLPARSADFADESAGRSMTSSEISRGLSAARGTLTRCIADARGNANLSAKMTLKFLVDGSGRVGAVRARAPSYMQKRGLLACARSAVRGARFPASGAPTVVTLPFEVE